MRYEEGDISQWEDGELLMKTRKRTPDKKSSNKHGETDVLVSMKNLDSAKEQEQEAIDTIGPGEF